MSNRYPGKSIGQRSEVASAARKETSEHEYDSPREPSARQEGYKWPPVLPGVERTPLLAAEGRVYGYREAGPNYVFGINDNTRAGDLHVGQYQIALSAEQAVAFAESGAEVRQAKAVELFKAAEQRAAQKRAAGAQR